MTSFAVALQVYTHSSVAVGAVGLAAAVPAIVLGLLGGSIVDAADRRTDTISFAAALYGVARLSQRRCGAARSRAGLRSASAGLRFIRGSQVLTGALLTDMSAMILGMPIALFSAINAERFGGAAQTLGLLTAAPAIGGLIGQRRSHHHSRRQPSPATQV